jgi:lipid-A-disaccharide synthase
MLETFGRLKQRHASATGLIAAVDAEGAGRIARCAGPMPPDVRVITAQTDAVLNWADVVFVASGTATLHIARQTKPMVIVYRVSRMSWNLIGRWLIDTRTFTLPNLIAAGGPHAESDRHIVREFVPWFGDATTVDPMVEELDSLVTSTEKREAQRAALRGVLNQFEGHDAGKEAAEVIARFVHR